MKSKPQIFIIHGGMTFKNRKDYVSYLKNRPISLERSKSWSRDYMQKMLGTAYEIVRPEMPMKDDAKYEDWEIHFERFIPYMRDGVTLIGNSLGSIFLAQYLSTHVFPKKIRAIHLVGAPFDNTHSDEDLVGGFRLPKDLSRLEHSTKNLTFHFSVDDDCVPPYHAQKYEAILPSAKVLMYTNKNGHFRVAAFPELIKMIKNKK